MDAINTGQFLQTLRKEQNLSQKDIAKLCGVSVQAVSKWERGDNMPDIEYLNRLSILYRVSINELIDGEKALIHVDIEKRKTIWSLTLSALVFIVYLFPFFSGSQVVNVDQLGIEDVLPSMEEALIPNDFGDITIEFTLRGYEFLFGATGFFLPMGWIVAGVLISHLIIRVYSLIGFMKKSKGQTLYLIGSSLVVLIISIGFIINPAFHPAPQFIIILLTILNLLVMLDEDAIKRFLFNLREYRKRKKEVQGPPRFSGKPLILTARILAGLLIVFNTGMFLFALYVFFFKNEPFMTSIPIGLFVFLLPALILSYAARHYGSEETPVLFMISTITSSVFILAVFSTNELSFSHTSEILTFAGFGILSLTWLILTLLAFRGSGTPMNKTMS